MTKHKVVITSILASAVLAGMIYSYNLFWHFDSFIGTWSNALTDVQIHIYPNGKGETFIYANENKNGVIENRFQINWNKLDKNTYKVSIPEKLRKYPSDKIPEIVTMITESESIWRHDDFSQIMTKITSTEGE